MNDPNDNHITDTLIRESLDLPEDPDAQDPSEDEHLGVIDSDAPPFDQDGNPIWE